MKIFKGIVTVILAILMIISTAGAIILYQGNSVIDNYQDLPERIIDSQYNYYVYNSVYEELDAQRSLILVSVDDISDMLTRDILDKEEPAALQAVITSLLTGSPNEWSYESEELYDGISSFLADYAKAENIKYTPGSDDSIYESVCDIVTYELKIIPDYYVTKLTPKITRLSKILNYWYVFIIIYFVCAVLIILLSRRDLKNAFYNIALSSFFGSFAVFISTAVTYSRDYLAITVLNDQALQHLIHRVYNIILYDLRNTALIVTIVFLVLSIIAIIIVSVQKKANISSESAESNTADNETDSFNASDSPDNNYTPRRSND